MPTLDVCYGPIAVGQFFIEELNPGTLVVYKTTGVLNDSVMICEKWGMNENRWVWSFGPRVNDGGWQVALSNLEQMKRVSSLEARHCCEQNLRHRDDEWRSQYAPDREPITIVRCNCGIGDDAPRSRHTLGCFLRGEFL